MRVLYYYNWGYFHPVRYGADTVAANHLAYFRERGWQVDVVLPQIKSRSSAADAFAERYSWVDSITLIDLPECPVTFREQLYLYDWVAKQPATQSAFDRPADLFLTNYIFTAPLTRLLPVGCRKVVETHDILADQTHLSDVPRWRRDYLRALEIELYRLFDGVVMISRDELATVRACGAQNAHYVPQFAAQVPPLKKSPEPEFDLLFLGSDIAPNVDGLQWFYHNVYVPFLWQAGVRLAIAGGISREFPCRDHNVHVLGRVDEVVSAFARAKVVLSPVFRGTGLSIKMIESLAHGNAVIAAPASARGLDTGSGAFLTDDMVGDPAGTASKILELLADPIRRQALERRAAEYANREFGRDAFFRGMDDIVQSVGLVASKEPVILARAA